MATLIYAVGRPELPPFKISDRIRHEICYFMSISGEPGVPQLGQGEYWISLDKARGWLDAGAIQVVSPLDSENRTEVELSEEQEAWLEWMASHKIEHVRLA